MKYKVGQMVAYEWPNVKVDLGVIIEVSKGAKHPYKIEFPVEGDIDWYTEHSVDDMIQTLEYLSR